MFKVHSYSQLLYISNGTPMHITFKVLINNDHYIELRASMYFHGQQFTCSGPIICADAGCHPWGSEYSKDLSSFSHTVHRVLSALSSADPARVNCLSKQVAGRGDWEKESKTWKMSPSGMCLKRLGGIDLFSITDLIWRYWRLIGVK